MDVDELQDMALAMLELVERWLRSRLDLVIDLLAALTENDYRIDSEDYPTPRAR